MQHGFDGQIPPRTRAVRDIEGDGKRQVTVEHRIDRLQWLLDHKSIAEYQFAAGRRLQSDWQKSKIEVCASANMLGGGSGHARSTLSDTKLDAGTRLKEALATLPTELLTLTTIFLLPEDHAPTLERLAASVRLHKQAVAFGIRTSLTILARHYGYST